MSAPTPAARAATTAVAAYRSITNLTKKTLPKANHDAVRTMLRAQIAAGPRLDGRLPEPGKPFVFATSYRAGANDIQDLAVYLDSVYHRDRLVTLYNTPIVSEDMMVERTAARVGLSLPRLTGENLREDLTHFHNKGQTAAEMAAMAEDFSEMVKN
ncbi:hypothetical protein H696_04316 [Fonticula alba]|uniref:Uncharacterized protein n=1 Tax=Fonticula alba TaxID=691883 RepID=A0A058Z5U9_FONAL|nr:hypothetical protein H696_04316 [Fonticula alba]KCV68897.1 hypothetical protein H696_04316 [Fonticula alba]|eukprot:XP_009496468.1 hypothetical protein H696_04316 [Fonticula alba]